MQKINFINPVVFEILKLKNPTIWLAESIFGFKNAHPKLHDQFIALLYLHAKNQLYTSISFWDIKVLKASLGMPGHTWQHPPEILSSICSFNRYVPTCKKFITPIVFEILKFKNLAIWLAESIFAFTSRTLFFQNMQFQQNHIGHYGASFKPKKSTHQWIFFPAKSKKTYFGGVLGHYTQNVIVSEKSGSVSFLLTQPIFVRSKITFRTSSNKPAFVCRILQKVVCFYKTIYISSPLLYYPKWPPSVQFLLIC